MIVAAVVCPHPPLLLRELSGAEDAVPALRAACREALASVLDPRPDAVVVVGGAGVGREWDTSLPIEVRPFGTTAAPRVGLPLSLGVGKRLLEGAGWDGVTQLHSLPWDAGTAAVAELARTVTKVEGRVAVLVMGDGSSREWVRPPGRVDERASALDDEVGSALARGDAAVLARLDPARGIELSVQGWAAFAVLGEVVTSAGAQVRSRVLYREAPYEVEYTVAVWDLE